MKFSHVLRVVVLTLVLIMGGIVAAQDDETEIPYAGIYEDVPFNRAEDGAFTLGDPDAPVTVIEFADFLCPHCQDYREIIEQFIQEYVVTGRAKFEYRFTPIIDEQVSPLFAALNECAHEEGLFWQAHYLLYDIAESGAIDQNLVGDFAEQLGLDGETLAGCVTSADQFLTDYAFAGEMSVNGTPAIRVRVNDGEAGVIAIDGQSYGGGGVPLEILGQFVESENPEELVRLLNQLRNPALLQDTSIADSTPCGAPCWRGIIPGETTFAQALIIIEADDTLVNVESQEQGGARIAVWAQEGGDPCCELLSLNGETIDLMRLLTAPEVTAGEVLEEHGDPQYVSISEVSASQAFFTLIYPDKSMMVFAFVEGAEAGELSADSEVIGLQYLSPASMAQFLNASELRAWEGYDTYQAYAERDFVALPDATEGE